MQCPLWINRAKSTRSVVALSRHAWRAGYQKVTNHLLLRARLEELQLGGVDVDSHASRVFGDLIYIEDSQTCSPSGSALHITTFSSKEWTSIIGNSPVWFLTFTLNA